MTKLMVGSGGGETASAGSSSNPPMSNVPAAMLRDEVRAPRSRREERAQLS
jgi:hypothetical protein